MNNEIESIILQRHSTSALLLVEELSSQTLCTEAWDSAKQHASQTTLLKAGGLALGIAALGLGGYYLGKRLSLGSISGLQKIAEIHHSFSSFFKRTPASRLEHNAFSEQVSSTEKIYSSFKMGDVHGYHVTRGISEQVHELAKTDRIGALSKTFRSTLF